ncbi:MAG: ROK family protein, partial [Candidatus Riflebacteria bacterium]|nr:ROK family protein [Candidatus Riflebacteria bacterium]
MSNKYSLGIDLGGTKIAAGLCKDGEILKKVVFPTSVSNGTQHLLKTMVDAAKQAMDGQSIE